MELDKGDQTSPVEFRLDPASGVPTYLQLVQQVEQALRMGWLTEGDRLPRVREVVAGLAINPNTVLKAYRELEHRGLAVGRRGQGTFVRGLPAGVVPLRERAALRRGLLDWMRSARNAGLDEGGMVAVFEDALRDLREGRDGVVA
ncbi:GntR family transcriptional regulator [Kitasatospora sp. NPDC087314]|uniref:GntR family transcriptional regulator n=1 Tax=Kitasatospora sp. NPDC087314 TaxID=3364068 RepID=UPI00380F681B